MALSQSRLQRKRTRKDKKKRERRNRRREYAGAIPRYGKLSEAIGWLAKPIIDEFVDNPKTHQNVLMLAVAAWNTSLLPPDQREESFQAIARQLDDNEQESEEFVRWMFELIMERKQHYFPHANNVIVDASYTTQEDGGVYFQVMYSP